MYCSKCGGKLSENSKFCQVCGTPIRIDTAVLSPAAKKSGKKPLFLALLVVAVLIVLAGGVFAAKIFLLDSGANTEYKTTKNLLVVSGEQETQVFSGANKSVTINGLCNQYTYSMDGKQVALKMDINNSGASDLWICNKDKVDNIDDNVYSFVFSANGNKILYLKDFSSYTGDLYVYDVASEKSRLVVKDAYTDYAISPDGKSLAYAADVSTDASGYLDSVTGYVILNGDKAITLGKNQCAFAMANDGKYIYYIEIDCHDSSQGILYIHNEKSDKKIGTIDLYNPLYLNSDNTEIMFVKSDATYICANGADKQKVSDLALYSIITSENVQYLLGGSYGICATTLGVSSLTNQIVASGDSDNGGTTLTYLKSDGKTVDIDDLNDYYYMYDISLMTNGKSLYYMNDAGKIVYYDDYRDARKSPEKIRGDKSITTFAVVPDQSAIYYVDTDNTLWVQRGDKEPEEIESDVDTYSIKVSYDGKGIYYIADYKKAENGDGYAGNGTLYYIGNTSKSEPMMIADKAYRVEVSQYGTTYFSYDHIEEGTGSYIGAVFISQNDKDFESIMYDAIIG